jgi:hypothetical protein
VSRIFHLPECFLSGLHPLTSFHPESIEPTTNLIAIPELHAHEETAHLEYQISTLHQQVLEKVYALPPLRTWENEWSPLPFGKVEDLYWSEVVEKAESCKEH